MFILDDNTRSKLARFVRSYLSPSVVRATISNAFPTNVFFDVRGCLETETAYTFFDHVAQIHRVVVGADFKNYFNADRELQKKNIVLALLIHELGHTHFTDPDLEKINALCEKAGIPFSLFNLAEDARIEFLIKRLIYELTGIRYEFLWDSFFEMADEHPGMTPEKVLYNMIQVENKREVRALCASRVGEYYTRFLQASDSAEVINILKEWKAEFHNNQDQSLDQNMKDLRQEAESAARGQPQGQGGQNQPQGGQGPGQDDKDGKAPDDKGPGGGKPQGGDKEGNENKAKGSGEGEEGDNPIGPGHAATRSLDDLSQRMRIAQSQEMQDFLMQNSMSLSEIDKEPDNEVNQEFKVDTEFESVSITEASNTNSIFSGTKENEFYSNELPDVLSMLKELKHEGKKRYQSRNQSNRLNSRALSGIVTDPVYTKLYERKKDILKKIDQKLLVVLDLSGSMGGSPAKAQRTLMLALNRLAEQFPKLDVHIIGSKVLGRKSLYETVHLPHDESKLLSATANGSAEGIGYALEHNPSLIKEKDTLLFITDGRIHDKEIDKKMLRKLTKPGAKMVGLYVGDASIPNEKMNEWFDRLIIGDDVVSTIARVILEINPQSKKVLNSLVDLDKSVAILPNPPGHSAPKGTR